MARAAEALAGAAEGISGQVRIGAPDGAANYLLPQVVARIVAANPGLEVQIVALPRVFSLTRREADMVIAVSKPEQGRVIATKITDYRLSLAASDAYLGSAPPLGSLADLPAHRVIGYIPDMIFDRELDYLADLGVEQPPVASNSVSVQLNLIRQGAGVGVVHDFALPAAPGVRRVLTRDFGLTRAFHLIRHADDRRVPRIERFADVLVAGLRAEVARLDIPPSPPLPLPSLFLLSSPPPLLPPPSLSLFPPPPPPPPLSRPLLPLSRRKGRARPRRGRGCRGGPATGSRSAGASGRRRRHRRRRGRASGRVRPIAGCSCPRPRP